MTTSNEQIDWEVQQLWMAIDYYERARKETFSRNEASKFEDTIKKLNAKIKKLERNRYESHHWD